MKETDPVSEKLRQKKLKTMANVQNNYHFILACHQILNLDTGFIHDIFSKMYDLCA
jgi:hypothetical protein